jgi:hypothetical protein
MAFILVTLLLASVPTPVAVGLPEGATAVPADRLLTLIDRADVKEGERLLVTTDKN